MLIEYLKIVASGMGCVTFNDTDLQLTGDHLYG